jgi:hypothetical protein
MEVDGDIDKRARQAEPKAVGSPPEVWRRSDHLGASLRDDVIRFEPRCPYAFFQQEGFDARDSSIEVLGQQATRV